MLYDDCAAGPCNTSQLKSVADRHAASVDNTETYINGQTESHVSHDLDVHTADMSSTSVDVFHAYCALAVVKHRLTSGQYRLTDGQCVLPGYSDQLTAREVAGLCRLLLWDVDVRRKRYSEELLYIDQLRTGFLAATGMNQHSGEASHDISQVADELTSQDESSPMRTSTSNPASSVAVNSMQMSIISREVDGLPECSEWQSMPIDIKYSVCPLSEELLQQETDRLRRLRDSLSHCKVIFTTGSDDDITVKPLILTVLNFGILLVKPSQ